MKEKKGSSKALEAFYLLRELEGFEVDRALAIADRIACFGTTDPVAVAEWMQIDMRSKDGLYLRLFPHRAKIFPHPSQK